MDMNTYTHTYKFRRDTTRRFSKNGFVLARVPPGPVVYICSTVCVNIMHKSYLKCLVMEFAIVWCSLTFHFNRAVPVHS